VKNEKRAIDYWYCRGPSFGDNDLSILDDTGFCIIEDYEKQIRETTDKFVIEEYEVYQVRPSK
jgi:hypothetical protein